jgi:hypothetical protein
MCFKQKEELYIILTKEIAVKWSPMKDFYGFAFNDSFSQILRHFGLNLCTLNKTKFKRLILIVNNQYFIL